MKSLITALFFLFPVVCFAQDASPIQPEVLPGARMVFGVFGGISLNQHSASFSQLPGTVSCCPEYREGSGVGFTVGGLWELWFAKNFAFSTRAAFRTYDGVLVSPEPTTVRVGNTAVPGEFEHQVKLSMPTLGLDLQLSYYVVQWAYIVGGVSVFAPLAPSIVQQEQLTQPSQGDFGQGQRIRNRYEVALPDPAGVLFGVLFGGGLEISLANNYGLVLAPEVTMFIPFGDVTTTSQWSINQLRLIAALKFLL